nr:ORF 1 protein [Beet western yellows virus associated RNA]QOY47089.1 ORF 1 protein [Beet western yellows virus associated RNA]
MSSHLMNSGFSLLKALSSVGLPSVNTIKYSILGASIVAAGTIGSVEYIRYKLGRSDAAHLVEDRIDSIESVLEVDDPDLDIWESSLPSDPRERATLVLKGKKKLSRRVRPSRTQAFIRVLRAEVKAEMGTPAYNAANVAVIRHMVDRYCRERNIRKTSYAHLLADVVAAVFVPYKAEYRQAAASGSLANRLRRWFVEVK